MKDIHESKLKPCPFCGGKARVNTTHDYIDDSYPISIWCQQCGAQTRELENGIMIGESVPYPLPVEVLINLWNTRKEDGRESEMKDVDERIKELGFEEVEMDLLCHCITYQCAEDDHKVTIQWDEDDNECLIYSSTVSEYYDDFGHSFNHPVGLTMVECSVFMEKINQMRSTNVI